VGRGLRKSPHLDLWLALHRLGPTEVDCRQGTLFRQGESSQGVYLVEEGRVKLLLATQTANPRELVIAGPGAVLGLAESLTGGAHRLTAEAQNARISCIERESFVHQLHQDQQLCLQIVHLLSEDLHSLYHRFRMRSSTYSSGERDRFIVH
jgi:CRP-like cAMP-binding protein